MGAIGVHHTETSEGGWDGPANEARLNADGTAAYYRRAFAWQDPEGDPETKAAYRFIHHEVSGDGTMSAMLARLAKRCAPANHLPRPWASTHKFFREFTLT